MPNTRCPMSVATECSTNLGSSRRGNIPRAAEPDPDAGPPRPTAGRLHLTSARHRRSRPPPAGLPPVQKRSVLRYTPSASGHLSETAQVILTKRLLPDSEARCATLFEKCGLSRLLVRDCLNNRFRNKASAV